MAGGKETRQRAVGRERQHTTLDCERFCLIECLQRMLGARRQAQDRCSQRSARAGVVTSSTAGTRRSIRMCYPLNLLKVY